MKHEYTIFSDSLFFRFLSLIIITFYINSVVELEKYNVINLTHNTHVFYVEVGSQVAFKELLVSFLSVISHFPPFSFFIIEKKTFLVHLTCFVSYIFAVYCVRYVLFIYYYYLLRISLLSATTATIHIFY